MSAPNHFPESEATVQAAATAGVARPDAGSVSGTVPSTGSGTDSVSGTVPSTNSGTDSVSGSVPSTNSGTDSVSGSDVKGGGGWELSPESLAAIEREVAKYPPGRGASAVMAALRIAQRERGWLSREMISFVAERLGVPAIRALEVATFYNMYDLRPAGRRKICVCTNLPCALRGAEETADALKSALGIGFGETTSDGMFTLVEGECFGACDMAPVVIVNNERMLGPIPPEEAESFLQNLRGEPD